MIAAQASAPQSSRHDRIVENRGLGEELLRRCWACDQVKPFDQYGIHKLGSQGRRATCKPCSRAERSTPKAKIQKRKQAARRANRKRKTADLAAKTKKDSLDKEVENIRRAATARMMRAARILARPWLAPDLTEAQRYRMRYRLDSEFALSERVRRQIRKRANKGGLHDRLRSALARGGKSPTASAVLGYSVKDLYDHLERQFTTGMTWDRFRSGDIHIDHITPVSVFDLTSEKGVRECWALPNLRPMWAKENISKGAAILYLV